MSNPNRGLLPALMLAALSLWGCDEKAASGEGGMMCTPGTAAACTCEGGAAGLQRCGDDGGLEACLCDADGGLEPDAGGACTPGEMVICGCPDGGEGSALCEDGGIVGECACEVPDAEVPDAMTDAEVPDAELPADCASVCGAVVELCPGAWADGAACEAACEAWAEGEAGETTGDSLQCRIAWLAQEITEETTLGEICEALGPDSGVCTEDVICAEYCDVMMESCPESYADEAQCRALCGQLPQGGEAGDLDGDTVQCRISQAQAGACEAAALDGGGVCGARCENYCALMAANCDDVFATRSACLASCAAFEIEAPLGMAHGDTFQCRLYQSAAAGAFDEAASRCLHARPEGANGAGQCGLCPSDTAACLPAGTFQMGSPEEEPGRSPQESQHAVTLTRAYVVMRSELTQTVWDDTGAFNPSSLLCPEGEGDCDSPLLPIETLTWYRAVAFANTLSMAEGLTPCYGHPDDMEQPYTFDDGDAEIIPVWVGGAACEGWRLPTEAEWEYAARGGDRAVRFPWGNEEPSCERVIYGEDAENLSCGRRSLWPVCSRPEGNTPEGLCDMAGNGWEWTFDWGAADYGGFGDPAEPVVDPVALGPYDAHVRVLRGGSGYTNRNSLRCAHRFGEDPARLNPDISARLVRTLPSR